MEDTLIKIDFEKKEITCLCGDRRPILYAPIFESPFCKSFLYWCDNCQLTYTLASPKTDLYIQIENDEETTITEAYTPTLFQEYLKKMYFYQAMDYVIKSKQIAYAFKPKVKDGRVVGGLVYIMYYECLEPYDPEIDEEPPNDNDCIFFIYIGSGAEYDQSNYADVDDDAKSMDYRISDLKSSHINEVCDCRWDIALKILSGLPKEKALESCPCPDCDQILYKTGKAQPCLKCKNT